MILLVSVVAAISAFFLVLFLVTYFRKRKETNLFHRMRRHGVAEIKSMSSRKKTVAESFYEFIRRITKPVADKKIFAKLDLKLKQAGLPLLGAECVVTVLILAVVAFILVYMTTINQLIAMLIGLSVPLLLWMLMVYRIRKRKNSFTEQLGDCLITFANALRAGYSFQQAMDVIAKEMESPIAQEFARASTDIKMGVPLEVALEQMESRVNSSDFTLVVTAVLIQREVGGNLAQILDTISDTIMDRIRMKREINALTAQGRFSAIVLLVLPFGIGIFMYMINPGQMSILFEETAGQMAIVAAIIMDIIGFVIIQRIVNIDV